MASSRPMNLLSLRKGTMNNGLTLVWAGVGEEVIGSKDRTSFAQAAAAIAANGCHLLFLCESA